MKTKKLLNAQNKAKVFVILHDFQETKNVPANSGAISQFEHISSD